MVEEEEEVVVAEAAKPEVDEAAAAVEVEVVDMGSQISRKNLKGKTS